MDAYKGLAPSDRNAYSHQLHRFLIDNVNATAANVNFVQGQGFYPVAYERAIKAAGGIDLQLLGLGGEGHLGFNERGSSLASRTREITLSERTLADNAVYFNKIDETVPTHAYTMGLGTILEAKELLVLANNPNKALVVQALMETLPPTRAGKRFVEKVYAKDNTVESLPARALYAHSHVTVMIDEEAASLVNKHDLETRGGLSAEDANALIQKFATKELVLTINGQQKTLLLPPNFDFFDPSVMGIDDTFDRHNPIHTKALEKALTQATDIAVGAHPDDIEIMASGLQLQDKEDGKKYAVALGSGDGWGGLQQQPGRSSQPENTAGTHRHAPA